MHIAIDDTYGPGSETKSKFVTGSRRTHVAVVFRSDDVEEIRTQLKSCLEEVNKISGISAKEFHFVDIYNRKSPWNSLADQANLKLFEFFAFIYRQYRWPVLIQTIDTLTLRDHGIDRLVGRADGLDLSNNADLSLLWLLIKVKTKFRQNPSPIELVLDEGREKPGNTFGSKIFHDWPETFSGIYRSSSEEPLLQLADFVAFCVNRSTHLAMKSERSEVDNWFLGLVAGMQIVCDDLKTAVLPKDFSVADFDHIHSQDRAAKGV